MFRLASMLLVWSLGTLAAYSSGFHPPDSVIEMEIPRYELPDPADSLSLVLHMDYAKAGILNPADARRLAAGRVYEINLVFTRYPYSFDRWCTNYDWLLEQRLRSLYALDSSLFERKNILWKYILQTACETEPEAKTFFHGFVIYMYPGEDEALISAQIPPLPSEKLVKMAQEDEQTRQLTEVIYKWEKPLEDSTIFKVFDRHPQWKKKLVVMDWTSSMYKNGASVLRWQSQHLENQAIQHLVLFNDGDRTPHAQKRIGKTGGIYYVNPKNLEAVVQSMIKVKYRGGGGDSPENDMEALLRATRSLKDYEEVILIADRNSSIRDIRLLKYLDRPVHVVVFKNKEMKHSWNSRGKPIQIENEWIHPHYLSLASISGGSLHTHNRDIYQLSEMKPGEVITIGTYHYQKQENGGFKVLRN
ncbi:MAG: hypothetical protein D6730_17270 [Bacteroidetes bacterium]|nr:MAG: hypothetical protein D6730_17270 [Bacteroidota bacterium]